LQSTIRRKENAANQTQSHGCPLFIILLACLSVCMNSYLCVCPLVYLEYSVANTANMDLSLSGRRLLERSRPSTKSGVTRVKKHTHTHTHASHQTCTVRSGCIQTDYFYELELSQLISDQFRASWTSSTSALTVLFVVASSVLHITQLFNLMFREGSQRRPRLKTQQIAY